MNSPVSVAHLVDALRAKQLDATLTKDRQVVVILPSTLDQLILSPSRSAGTPRLFWQRRTFLGTATHECGHLEWTADPRPLVAAVLGYAHSTQQIAPQYGAVIDALRVRGLDAGVVPADGGRHLVCVYLADGTYLLIGCPEALPPRLAQVTGWHVRHEGPEERIAVVYRSDARGQGLGATIGGPDINLMVEHVVRYVRETAARYGGHHPLAAPTPHKPEPTAASLAWLVRELTQLPRIQYELSEPGGALLTIAERDGANATAVEVPDQLVRRMYALLLTELTSMQRYGG
ncbi:hypothetical protein [Streptomyces sp. NEAU-174]|uniref:hypothetical protein n=1 Tax=Streptomyces sp. NEAU-174 TaxID=3458254 RepID=UPI004043E20F